MRRTGLLLCIIIVLSLTITGCWSRREMNTLAIAVGLGIDKSGAKYKVTVQVVEPGEVSGKSGGGGGVAPVTYYQTTGDSLLDALRKMTTDSPRKIYIAHLRIVILGEALAREGIGNSLELLTREPEARNDFFIVVAKEGSAADTLRVLTNLERVPSVRLFSSLEASEKQWAPTAAIKLDELIANLTSEGINPVLTGLKLIGDVKVGETVKNVETVKSPATLQYSGLAVFKKDKLIGWLSNEEGKGYNYIQNRVSSTAAPTKCPNGGIIILKVIRSSTKVKGSLRHERPQINIKVHTVADVAEVQCRLDLTNPETIAEVEQWAARREEELIEQTIARAQKDFKVDFLGFGEAIRRSNPRAWKSLKHNWNHTFENMPVHVKVDFKVNHTGKVSNSFLEKLE